MSSSAEPIAIVGMECIFPGAGDLAAYWRNIVRGVDATSDLPQSRWDPDEYSFLKCRRGGFIEGLTDFDPVAYGLMPAAVFHGDPEHFLVYRVIHGALCDLARGRVLRQTGTAPADAPLPTPLPDRTEVVVGRGSFAGHVLEFTNLQIEFITQVAELLYRLMPAGTSSDKAASIAEIRKLLEAGLPEHSSREMMLGSSVPSVIAGRIANRLDLICPSYIVDAACAAGLIATETVVNNLRNGLCDLGVAAAVHLVHRPYFWYAFDLLHAPSKVGRCRPFDEAADGLLIAEGLGAVVLKRLSDAERDGDRVYAVLRGLGTSSDGRGKGLLTPRTEGQVVALRRAYEQTGLSPSSVTLVEAHGTGMPVGDLSEIATLHAVFGQEGLPQVALGSVKSMIGHTMAAAGMAGLIKTVLAVYHRVLPPTLHVETPHPDLKASRLYVNSRSRPWISPLGRPRRAGVNSFGFGGINAHAVLEESSAAESRPGPAESLMPWGAELFLVGVPSRDALVGEIDHWLGVLATLRDEEFPAAAFTAGLRFSPEARVRLAVTATSLDDLKAKLSAARQRILGDEDHWEVEGVSFFVGPRPGKLGVLFRGLAFPGLAGGYTDRLAELCTHFPEVRDCLDLAETLAQANESLPYSLSHQCFPPPFTDAATLARLERELIWSRRTPLAQSMATLAVWKLLEGLGLPVDAAAGFSMGEWTSLLAAGVVDPQHAHDMLQIWFTMGDAPEQMAGVWGLVSARPEQLHDVLRQTPGTVGIIMDGMGSQTFIAGDVEAVRSVLAHMKRQRVVGHEVPFPAVHTPLAEPLIQRVRAVLPSVEFRRARHPMYCSFNAQPYPDDPALVREWLIETLRNPVLGGDTVRRMHDDGVRIFVEVGIGGKWALDLPDVLKGRPYFAVGMDSRGSKGLEPLLKMLGRLSVLGVPINFHRLYTTRRLREIDLSGNKPASSRTARPLSLAPPRIRLPEESVARLRQMLAGESPAASGGQASRPARPVLTGAESYLHTASPVAPDGVAMMEQILQSQELADEEETRLLGQLLEKQMEVVSQLLTANGHGWSRSRSETRTGAVRQTALPQAPKPSAAPLALAGQVVSFAPGREMESRLVLDLDTHLFLEDHSFIKVPPEYKPLEERLPVLPMMVGIEILCEAAQQLVPDLVVAGCSDVTASRWIAFQSQRQLPLTIRARRKSPTEVDVEVCTEESKSPALKGRVNLAPALPPSPPPIEVPEGRPYPLKASDLYDRPLLFHGPRFHVVTRLTGLTDGTATAELTVRDPHELFADRRPPLLFDSVVLDGIAQAAGATVILDDWLLYPLRLGKVTRYGPPLPPGSLVRVRIRYRKSQARIFEFDADALDPAGNVWMRVEGSKLWRVIWDPKVVAFVRRPRDNPLHIDWPVSGPQAVACRMNVKILGELSPDWIARYCLTTKEMEIYRRRKRISWLLGRLALKGAVREWYLRHRGKDIFPLDIETANLPSGAVVLTAPADENLAVSLSHLEDEAVAVVAPVRGVGVDLADVVDRGVEFRDLAFDAEELRVLNAAEGELLEWLHRAWCAKEALAKAHGLGLDGLPHFRVRGVGPDGIMDLDNRAVGTTFAVPTYLNGGRASAVVFLE